MYRFHELGPNVDFQIKFVGDMKRYNGNYDDSSEEGKDLIQLICHMVYQIKDEFKAAGSDVFRVDGLWGLCTRTSNGDHYILYTSDMMTVFHITETGYHSFEVEFLSMNQCRKLNPLFGYAYSHQRRHGRAE